LNDKLLNLKKQQFVLANFEGNPIEGVDLGLPDGISHTPQSSQHIHN
jgi:hypothetical protein